MKRISIWQPPLSSVARSYDHTVACFWISTKLASSRNLFFLKRLYLVHVRCLLSTEVANTLYKFKMCCGDIKALFIYRKRKRDWERGIERDWERGIDWGRIREWGDRERKTKKYFLKKHWKKKREKIVQKSFNRRRRARRCFTDWGEGYWTRSTSSSSSS